MFGAACGNTGEMVHPIGTEPRAGSRHSLSMRCWLYCRLSPSLMVKETYTLGAGVDVCLASVACLMMGAVDPMLVHTSKLEKKSLASTAFAASEARVTPLPSSINQPRCVPPGGSALRICAIKQRSDVHPCAGSGRKLRESSQKTKGRGETR